MNITESVAYQANLLKIAKIDEDLAIYKPALEVYKDLMTKRRRLVKTNKELFKYHNH